MTKLNEYINLKSRNNSRGKFSDREIRSQYVNFDSLIKYLLTPFRSFLLIKSESFCLQGSDNFVTPLISKQ